MTAALSSFSLTLGPSYILRLQEQWGTEITDSENGWRNRFPLEGNKM